MVNGDKRTIVSRDVLEKLETVAGLSLLAAVTAVAARVLPVVPGVIVFAVVLAVLEMTPRRAGRFRRPHGLQRQVDGLRRTALYDAELGVYQGWYFDLRLREEAARCKRYGLSMAVVIVKVL